MGSDMNQLLTGQAQAVTGWLTNTNALSILGPDRVDLMLWDTGIQLYANVYYTTDDMLDEHSDVLANFLGASARGWGYAQGQSGRGCRYAGSRPIPISTARASLRRLGRCSASASTTPRHPMAGER